MGSIGPLEVGIVLVIVLIIFGPKRLPGLGKQLGTGMREFKESVTGEDKAKEKEAERAALNTSQQTTVMTEQQNSESHSSSPEQRS